MTEAEWQACADPKAMLEFLWDKESDRKLRLFAIACCQSSRQLMLNKDHRKALEVSARFADGQATSEVLATAYQRANDFACGLYQGESEREIHRWAEATAVANALAMPTPDHRMAGYAADAVWMMNRAARRDPNARLAQLLREICGNPFRREWAGVRYWDNPELLREIYGNPLRPVKLDSFGRIKDLVDPVWLTTDVLGLAEGIYQDRKFDRMPILADALEDAGCDDADMLGHCRRPGEHVRGCWVVDLLTGKK